MKRYLKKTYINDALREYDSNSKKNWCLLKELWPTKSKNGGIQGIADCGDDVTAANKFNDHFVSVGPNLRNNIPDDFDHELHVKGDENSFTSC